MQVPIDQYARAYSIAVNVTLEASLDNSYPELPASERKDLVFNILNRVAYRHGYRLAPLIVMREDHDE
jgi:hypothetical protein